MDIIVIKSRMINHMEGEISTTINIKITLMKIKLFRTLLLLSVVIFFIIIEPGEYLVILIPLTVIYSILIFIFVYIVFTLKQHLFSSLVLLVSELLISSTFLVFIRPFLLLPIVCIQAVELVISKWRKLYIFVFLGNVSLMMLIGFFVRHDLKSVYYSIPAFLAMILLLFVIYFQYSKTKKEYEYMKKLIDNKNKLLSTLTHELRTPLAVIKTSNELIYEERPGPINETQKSLIFSSLENTKRLNSLVENILSQVKVEFAWFSMKQQPLDIRKLVRKTSLDIKPYLETRSQSIKYNYPSLMSKTIGDKRWLEQVLLNLIHNGSKNSPDNTVITISVQENEQCIVVSVHDRGSGIESKEISHVFNEFYQSTDPTKNLNEGAGLGLTIVKDIIEKHKGNIYISSLINTGTTVSFTLPIYKGVFSGTHNPDN